MRVQLNSGSTVAVDSVLTRLVKGDVERVLARFAARVTRVEIHLNGLGPAEIRCLIEVRPRRARPVAASAVAPSMTSAVTRALSKMRRALDTFFDKPGHMLTSAPAAAKKKPRKQNVDAKRPTTAKKATARKATVRQR
jgi:hypothetical protein